MLRNLFLFAGSIFLAVVLNHNHSTMAALRAIKAANKEISLSGKTAVVVGGTSGIGHGVAKRLALAGASVTIVGRSERGIVNELTALSPATAGATHSFVPVNAYLLSGVAEACTNIKAKHDRIDYLVQTQGMATIQGFTPSPEEGLDQKLTLHVYARAKFIRELQPLLSSAKDGRSLSILSAGVHGSYANYKEDPELSLGSYSIKNAADSAGFYNDIVMDTFSEQHTDVTFMHAAPGFVSTRWGTEMPAPIRWCVRALQVFGRSKEDCGEYMFKGLTAETTGSASRTTESKESSSTKSNFVLLNEYGARIFKTTQLHEEAKEFVFKHIMNIIDSGKAVQQPNSKN